MAESGGAERLDVRPDNGDGRRRITKSRRTVDADGLETGIGDLRRGSRTVGGATRRCPADFTIYAAGVRHAGLDGIFERPAIAALWASASNLRRNRILENPWSSTLLKAFAGQYASAIAESGLAETLAAGEAINPIAVEDLVLGAAERTSAEYASLSG